MHLQAQGAQRALLASSTSPSDALLAALARHHYSTGDLGSLTSTSTAASTSPSSERARRKAHVLELVGRAEWDEAERELRALVGEDDEDLEVRSLSLIAHQQCRGMADARSLWCRRRRPRSTSPSCSSTRPSSTRSALLPLTAPGTSLTHPAPLTSLQAIAHLHALLSSPSPSLSLAAHHSPAFLFNLCTLYELRSERAAEDKVRLLVAAAGCGGGAQGIEAASFKLAL